MTPNQELSLIMVAVIGGIGAILAIIAWAFPVGDLPREQCRDGYISLLSGHRRVCVSGYVIRPEANK